MFVFPSQKRQNRVVHTLYSMEADEQKGHHIGLLSWLRRPQGSCDASDTPGQSFATALQTARRPRLLELSRPQTPRNG